ncbi:unnamed protein product [Cunninghamella blakesleeana]
MASAQSSIANLTTETRATKGEIPPPLVGATTNIVGNYMYVFGGQLVTSRHITNHLYILNLTTLVWERHIGPPDSSPPPQPRYFHTASVYTKGKSKTLVIFGGMSYSNGNDVGQGLCAIDDLCFFDLETLTWKYPEIHPSIFTPQARYAHLAVCAHDKLMVIGGQDMMNQYILEINTFDLKQMAWIQGGPVTQQYGAYRAVAFCPLPMNKGNSPLWPQSDNNDDIPLCIYSNYNFTDVTRDLRSCRPLTDHHPVTFKDHSDDMSGTQLPPGLRFPTGHIIGHHMILTGTLLTPNHRSFHLWALNLANLVWVRVDTGSILSSGSWNKGILHHEQQKFYILGNRERDLFEDYNHRQMNFDHVVIVDLEAFGIYTHPESTCAPIAQELGLSMLNEPSMADMEIISSDQKSIPINSMILSQRWKYFANMLLEEDYHRNPHHKERNKSTLSISSSLTSSSTSTSTSSTSLSNKLFKHPPIQNYGKKIQFTETYAVTLAFLQYLYTDHLMTAQQHQPNILSRLLILAYMFDMPRLIQLTTHALHQILTISTASMVYETAALTCRTALQIRALRVMINTRKMLQQQQVNLSSNNNSINNNNNNNSSSPLLPQYPTTMNGGGGGEIMDENNNNNNNNTHPLSVSPNLHHQQHFQQQQFQQQQHYQYQYHPQQQQPRSPTQLYTMNTSTMDFNNNGRQTAQSNFNPLSMSPPMNHHQFIPDQEPIPRTTKSNTLGQHHSTFLTRQRQGSFANGQPLPPNMERPNIGIRF